MASAPPAVVAVGAICGAQVTNRDGEALGTIAELMVDTASGRISYAVLSFGGVLGVGEKLFAVPWDCLAIDPTSNGVTLDLPRARLDEADGFDKDAWPTVPDRSLCVAVHGGAVAQKI